MHSRKCSKIHLHSFEAPSSLTLSAISAKKWTMNSANKTAATAVCHLGPVCLHRRHCRWSWSLAKIYILIGLLCLSCIIDETRGALASGWFGSLEILIINRRKFRRFEIWNPVADVCCLVPFYVCAMMTSRFAKCIYIYSATSLRTHLFVAAWLLISSGCEYHNGVFQSYLVNLLRRACIDCCGKECITLLFCDFLYVFSGDELSKRQLRLNFDFIRKQSILIERSGTEYYHRVGFSICDD